MFNPDRIYALRTLRVIPLTKISLSQTAWGTDTDDPILDQMKAAEITTGGMDEENAREMVGFVCESRQGLSHERVVGMLGTATKDTWSAHETEDFVELSYANGCPNSRP